MIGNFTEGELEQLNELKNELLVYPKDYFFKNLNDISDFKEVCISMSSLQWSFLSSGFNLLIEFFKILGQVVCSLVAMQFSLASEQFCSVTNTALSAVTKLSLSICLLSLHIARLLTLLIATFYPQILMFAAVATSLVFVSAGELAIGGAFICLAGIGYGLRHLFEYYNKYTSQNERANSIAELKYYQRMVDEIFEERTFITTKLAEAAEKQKQILSYHRHKLFSSNNQPLNSSQEVLEYRELVNHVFQALQTYPEFISGRNAEVGYYTHMYRELDDHHTKTKQLVGELFSWFEDIECLRPNLSLGLTNSF